jgi:predicted nucleic acid-binding protein
MDRLFLDANILFSAAHRPGAGLLKFWKLRNVELCTSRYALEEARINLCEESQRRRLDQLAESLRFFDSASRDLPASISLPAKDIPILLAAIEARSTHLITGDLHHFGPYFGKRLAGILVLPPVDYLHLRPSSSSSG